MLQIVNKTDRPPHTGGLIFRNIRSVHNTAVDRFYIKRRRGLELCCADCQTGTGIIRIVQVAIQFSAVLSIDHINIIGCAKIIHVADACRYRIALPHSRRSVFGTDQAVILCLNVHPRSRPVQHIAHSSSQISAGSLFADHDLSFIYTLYTEDLTGRIILDLADCAAHSHPGGI